MFMGVRGLSCQKRATGYLVDGNAKATDDMEDLGANGVVAGN
jgi:hypothetical protein